MKNLLFLPLLLGLTSPVQARVDPEVHKRCKDVKDYLGCVKAQTGDMKAQPSELIPNSCPKQFAYVGAGQCRKFFCQDIGEATPILQRKHVCYGRSLGIFPVRLMWDWSLGKKYEPAFYTPTCPNREPGLGWGSTCDEERGLLPEKVSKKKNKLPTACRTGVWNERHPKCQRKEEVITSPMDMD